MMKLNHTIKLAAIAVLTAGLMLSAGSAASAFTVSADQQIDGATAPSIVGDGAGNTVTATGTSPDWLFDWTGVTDPGLSLGGFKLYAGLDDGVQGTLTLDLGGGSITGTGTLAIQTYLGDGNAMHSDHVVIQNVGDIDMGGIDTHVNKTSSGSVRPDAGNITIGTDVLRAGSIRVDYLYAQAAPDATTSNGYANPGNVAIYGSGDVLIQNDDGSVMGDILTRSNRYAFAGNITISHQGSFAANNLISEAFAQQVSGSPQAGNIELVGNAVTSIASGDFTANSILSSYTRSSVYSGQAGTITITGYTGVTVNDLIAEGGGENGFGANIEVTGIAGDITINGVVSADGRLTRADDDPIKNDRDGHLRLYTTAGSGGTVTLADLNVQKFSFAALDSDSGTSVVTGTLANFDTAFSSGAGSVGDPFVTTQTALRTPSGQSITYDPFAAAYLGLGTYLVADLTGAAGVGGLLTPSGTSRTWKGDTTAIWSADTFDADGDETASAAGEIVVFDGTGDTQAVSVETGSGTGPTAGAIRLAGGSSYTLNAGGGTITLDPDGAGSALLVADSASVDHAIAAPIALSADLTVSAAVSGQGVVVSGDISGAHTLTKFGDGFLTLSGSNSYTDTTVEAGTLNVGADALGSGTTTVNGGTLHATAAVDMGGSNLNLVGGQVTGTSFATTGSYNVQDGTVGAELGGTGELNKTTAGTVTLSAANTYSGDTTIDDGVLEVDGSLSAGSAVFVNGSGQLAGTGSVGHVTYQNGAVFKGNSYTGDGFSGTMSKLTVADGGIIAPGASPGATWVDGAGEWGADGIYEWEINDATGEAGAGFGTSTGWDLAGYDGELSIAATSGNPFTIKLISLDAGNSPGLAANFDPSSDYSWQIATGGGGVSGFDASKFTLDATGFLGAAASSFSIRQDANDIFLDYTGVAPFNGGTVYIDFSESNGTTGNAAVQDPSRNWNVVPKDTGALPALLAENGDATGWTVTIGGDFGSGGTTFDVAESGASSFTNAPGNIEWAIDAVAGDYFFLNNNDVGTVTLSDLDENMVYTIELVAARYNSSVRAGEYVVTDLFGDHDSDELRGDNVTPISLAFDARGDGAVANLIMTFSDLVPDANGQIVLTVTQTGGDFAYISGMRVTAAPVPEPTTVALMLLGGGLLGAARLRRRRP